MKLCFTCSHFNSCFIYSQSRLFISWGVHIMNEEVNVVITSPSNISLPWDLYVCLFMISFYMEYLLVISFWFYLVGGVLITNYTQLHSLSYNTYSSSIYRLHRYHVVTTIAISPLCLTINVHLYSSIVVHSQWTFLAGLNKSSIYYKRTTCTVQ